ncbi:hypothetical protein BJN34_21200 [Cupriavidus necator]|uniref:Glycosyltransferase n=1 Tax=Cupriavidus necator TaxID=106590 RepID=A0A1U9UUQ5_CUPNE|nr:glycosyltransferase family 4 protein [Cupriavidus necator]AQV96390.1 hypothetical protein BJN34_21200 [Cupriavidus necator]
MIPNDVWLTAHKELADQNSSVWGPEFPHTWGFHHPYRIALKPTGTPIARKDTHLPDNAIVLVTAGARLPQEIHGAWARQMVELLHRRPNVVWLLAGGDGTMRPALHDAPQQQRSLLPHHQDLRSVFRCCDIYVNPPRMRGGFSVAEAMAECLPVVTHANSDRGNRVGAAAVSHDDDYFAQLHMLLDDGNMRRSVGTSMQPYFRNFLDIEQSGPIADGRM